MMRLPVSNLAAIAGGGHAGCLAARFVFAPDQRTDQLSSSAVVIAFLGLLEALSIAKSIAHHTRQPLDYNRQCLAEGVANLVGGFFRCLPGSGSLSRSHP